MAGALQTPFRRAGAVLPRRPAGHQHNHGYPARARAPAWLAHSKIPFRRAGAMLPQCPQGTNTTTATPLALARQHGWRTPKSPFGVRVPCSRSARRAPTQPRLPRSRSRASMAGALQNPLSACGCHAPAVPTRAPALPAFGVREPCSRGARQGANAQRPTAYSPPGRTPTTGACQRAALARQHGWRTPKPPFRRAGAMLPQCPPEHQPYPPLECGSRAPAAPGRAPTQPRLPRSRSRASMAGALQNPLSACGCRPHPSFGWRPPAWWTSAHAG